MDRKTAIKEIAALAADATVSIDAQLVHLGEAGRRYFQHMDCPYKPGDIVTPRADSIYPHPGMPHLVLEVCDEIDPLWCDLHAGTTRDGAMFNMRVGVWRNGSMAAFWGESFYFDWFRSPTNVEGDGG